MWILIELRCDISLEQLSPDKKAEVLDAQNAQLQVPG